MTDEPWFVYLLECRTRRVYTGVTPDLVNRMTLHRHKAFQSRPQSAAVSTLMALSPTRMCFGFPPRKGGR